MSAGSDQNERPLLATELTLQPHVAQWTVQALARGASTVAIILGIIIIQGGAARWRDRIFEVALQFPGAPQSWGALIVVFGLVALVGSLCGRRKIVATGLYLCAVWTLALGSTLGAEAFQNPNVSRTDSILYFGTTVLFILLGAAYSSSGKRGVSVGGGK